MCQVVNPECVFMIILQNSIKTLLVKIKVTSLWLSIFDVFIKDDAIHFLHFILLINLGAGTWSKNL